MKRTLRLVLSALLLSLIILGTTVPVTLAQENYYYCKDSHGHVLKRAVVGAGAGAALGYLTGEGLTARGAVFGAGTGAAVGLMDKSNTLQNSPLLRRTLKGAAIGTGANIIRYRDPIKGALIGGLGGAAYHVIASDMGHQNQIPYCR